MFIAKHCWKFRFRCPVIAVCDKLKTNEKYIGNAAYRWNTGMLQSSVLCKFAVLEMASDTMARTQLFKASLA